MNAGAIESHGEAAPILHGGDLGAARLLFPGAPEPFIDLSTGINPYPYPVPDLSPDLFTRLPQAAALDRLAAVTAQAYGAPSAAHVVPAPGSQSLLPLVATLVRPGRAAVLGPTYAEHARAAARAGHRVEEVGDVAGLRHVDLAVVVNPNNPDGRIVPPDELLACAAALPEAGLMVVDEAFMDVCASASLAREVGRRNIVVLRSFGKFSSGSRVAARLCTGGAGHRGAVAEGLGPRAVAGPRSQSAPPPSRIGPGPRRHARALRKPPRASIKS